VLVLFGTSFYLLAVKRALVNQLILSAIVTIAGVNLLLNTHFYPELLKYQSGTAAARYIIEHNIPTDSIYVIPRPVNSLDFYSRAIIKFANNDVLANTSGIWIFANEHEKGELDKMQKEYTVIQVFDDYSVTKLSLKFLNPATREDQVSHSYLLKFKE
jgi:hypothetical protein